MRTLHVVGEYEIAKREITFKADAIGIPGELVNLVLADDVWSLVVKVSEVSGGTGYMKGEVVAVCPQAMLSRAREPGGFQK